MEKLRGMQKHTMLLRVLAGCLWVAAVLAVGISLGCGRTATCTYVSVNGDFQSYNVFRRILAGQRPYTDFANYIGMSPVWLCLLPTKLLGGSFAASLFSTSVIANLIFSVTVLVWFWLITENRAFALLGSVAFSKFCSMGLLSRLVGARWSAYFDDLFTRLYTPSNSMRVLRLSLPFLLAGLALLRLRGNVKENRLQQSFGNLSFCLILGALAGGALCWSSDFGPVTLVAISMLFLLLQLRTVWAGGRAFLLRTGTFAASAGLAWLTMAALVTGGHPGAWVHAQKATGAWQYYYFNGTDGQAALPYAFHQPRLLLYSLPGVVFLLYCLWRWWKKSLSDTTLLLGFLTLCLLGATWGYTLNGSGYHFTEALEGYFWLAAAAMAARALLWLLRRFTWRDRAQGAACAALCLALCLLAVRDMHGFAGMSHEGTYLEALGGWCPYPQAVVETAEAIGEDEIFSVYASGLEAATGRFQPTGEDYIIHALGEETRTQYIDAFKKDEAPWAQTPCLDLENWLTVANWDFYRALWADYTRVRRTEYSWLWQRQAATLPDVQPTVQVQPQPDGSVQLVVQAAPGTSFTADVAVDYTTSFKSGAGALLSLGHKVVRCGTKVFGDTAGVTAYLAPAGQGTGLPVRVENGYGCATLAAGDSRYAALKVTDARVCGVLPLYDLYA